MHKITLDHLISKYQYLTNSNPENKYYQNRLKSLKAQLLNICPICDKSQLIIKPVKKTEIKGKLVLYRECNHFYIYNEEEV